MTRDTEDALNIPKLSEAKSAIFESVNQLRKWRESQLRNFQAKQLSEHQSLLEQSEKNRKNLKQFLENKALHVNQNLDETFDSGPGSESTLRDSSVTGHFLRCFSDTSGDSSILSRSKEGIHVNSFSSGRNNGDVMDQKNNFIEDYLEKHNSAAAAPKRPKQPFLKKGSGLLRYMPRQNRNISNLHKSSAMQNTISENQTKSLLKSKLTVQNSTVPKQINRVQFKEPVAFMHYEELSPESSNQETPECDLIGSRSSEVKHNVNCSSNKDFEDDCDIHLSAENQELAEFEMLENCAQNSSFNSDSSVVQRVIHGEPIKKLYPVPKPSLQNYVKEFRNENLKRTIDLPIHSAKNNENKNVGDIETRKQQLQDIILDINPRITSLRNEISGLNRNSFESDKVSERCSTPIDHESNNASLSPVSNDDSSKDSSLDSIIFVPPSHTSIAAANLNVDVDSEQNGNNKNYEFNFEQKETASNLNSEVELSPISVDKQILREKMIELENEIQIYQETNARLSVIRKEREEILRKLKKEHDEIQKYKEEEKRKLDIEIENERKQLKRQKETFNRFQKLRRDNPGKKEREEMSALRQEVEKLQENMKRQKNKYTSDCRRMKNQLITAEKERDILKLQNISLEEQCQDLLTALKARNTKKKMPEVQIKADSKVENQICLDKKHTEVNKADEVQDASVQNVLQSAESNQTDHNCISNSSPAKPKVRFNLIPKYEHDTNLGIQKDLVQNISSDIDQPVQSNGVKNFEVDIDEMLQEEIVFEETRLGDKLERVYSSGEREIILPDGTLKHISPDGKTTKILYYNGDVKEIFPDKSEVYRYVTGVVEKHLPSGLQITEFPNGQIQQIYPDGLKEVRFPDSTTQYIFPNGTEEVLGNDGTVLRLDADGTETIEFSNGEKIIKTATSKRREYPDGSVKIIYNSGRQETRFANGRIRIKDKDGRLVVDTKHLIKGLGG